MKFWETGAGLECGPQHPRRSFTATPPQWHREVGQQKDAYHLYGAVFYEKEIWEIAPFTTATNNIKYLGVTLTKPSVRPV